MLRNDARLQRHMSERGFGALVAATAQNVRYLTDYESPSLYIHQYHGSYGVAVPGREPVLLTTLAGLEYMVGRPVATVDIRVTGTYVVERRKGAKLDPAEEETYRLRDTSPHYRSVIEGLAAIVRESAPAGSAIGVDESGFKPSALRDLREALAGYEFVEASEVFKDIRAVKSAAEMALLRKASWINEFAAGQAFAFGGTLVSEAAMESVFRAESARLGADPIHWETTLGPRSSGSYYAGDYVGRPGDIIRSDSSVRYRMYWADTGRTRSLGEAKAEQRRTYDALLAGQMALIDAVKPGLLVGDLFEIGIDTVHKAGLANYDRHHVGHAIGLEMYEPPVLTRGSDRRLEEGMVINVELPFYELGYVGLQIEDTLIVTAAGAEVITSADRSVLSIPA